MFKLKHFVQHAFLALALAFGSTAAIAGPTYSVAINTASFTGAGVIDFSFLSAVGADQTTASLSNFGGAFGLELDRFGNVVGDTATSLVFTNSDGFNYLALDAMFGGMLSFNITFDDGFVGPDQATFAVSLYDSIGDFLSSPVQFSLVPGQGNALSSIELMVDGSLARVAVVPEPSDLLLMLTALALLALVLRRRNNAR